jgi:hypothetical protein
MKIISCKVWNIFYIEGVRKGFTIKQLKVMLYFSRFDKIVRLHIPFWIMGYNREYADYIHRVSKQIRKDYEEK